MSIDTSSPPGASVTPQTQTFAAFDLSRIDHLSGDMDTLRSLIWVAVDLVAAKEERGENLLHAALNQYGRVNDQLQAIHQDLMAIRREATHA